MDPGHAEGDGSTTRYERPRPDTAPTGPSRLLTRIAPGRAHDIVIVFVGALAVLAALRVLAYSGSTGQTVAGIGYVVALVGLQVHYINPIRRTVDERTKRWVLLVQTGLVYGPFVQFDEWWLGLPGVLAGNVLLVLPRAVSVLLFGAIVASVGVLLGVFDRGPVPVVFGPATTVITGLAIYGLARLESVLGELHAARDTLAEKAVARERLRFTRDLHDLLGFSLSAITLKCELARKVVTKAPARARVELAEILDISRKAQRDVRSVAHGDRQRSLDEELAVARSILEAIHVDVRIERDDSELPGDVSTELATVLREAVTNVLRNGSAQWCVITVGEANGSVHLEVSNDGVPGAYTGSARTDDRAGGIGGLAGRMESLGGVLAADSAPDGTYTLRADIPVGDGGDDPDSGTARHGVSDHPNDSDGTDGGSHVEAPTESWWLAAPDIGRKVTAGVVAAALCGFGVISFAGVLFAGPGTGLVAWGLACLVALLAVQLGYFSRPSTRFRPPWSYAALLLHAALVYLPILALGEWWLDMPGFLAGSMLLVLRPAVSVPLCGAVLVSVAWLRLFFGGELLDSAGTAVTAAITAVVVYGLTRLTRLVDELHAVRDELAELAVAEERLRLARDVHDLLGLSLSAITLKSELAYRLLPDQPERAMEETAEILELARKALAEGRSVASGDRELSEDEELRLAESILTAAGIDIRITREHGKLSTRASTVLANVLREGVTNVLRHSKAEWCTITMHEEDGMVRLCIANDGVEGRAPESQSGSHDGSGLGNLSHRVGTLAGELTTSTVDGIYQLCVRIPAGDSEVRHTHTNP
ncbi:histidine kinase [Haloechinothrix sp. YIM 98757]|uniref:Histidine kinase n=1 Tax=Haloechinothrix aidingensis TaxID=2752311 RepID=A0A837ZXH6_9PSEU|nr:histidine kinase [Haloechinothrix aidingensis]MBA0125336.1 histidine kinase [Haloechinothrix aidingensis]